MIGSARPLNLFYGQSILKFIKPYAPLFLRFFFWSAALLIISTAIYLGRRPFRSELLIENIHPGINYQRGVLKSPHRTVYHLLEIDLTTSGLSFVGTEPESLLEYAAQTVEQFATANDTEISINGNFFYPFHSNRPWDYYPHQGDLVELSGLAINNGMMHSAPRAEWPALCISDEQRVVVSDSGRCPSLSLIHI